MANVYADLIRKGLRTLDDVPAHIREAVETLLDAAEESGGG